MLYNKTELEDAMTSIKEEMLLDIFKSEDYNNEDASDFIDSL